MVLVQNSIYYIYIKQCSILTNWPCLIFNSGQIGECYAREKLIMLFSRIYIFLSNVCSPYYLIFCLIFLLIIKFYFHSAVMSRFLIVWYTFCFQYIGFRLLCILPSSSNSYAIFFNMSIIHYIWLEETTPFALWRH